MEISVGTFNLNNLFSRYNFQAEIDDLPADEAGGLQLTFAPDQISVRSFMGRLVRPKDDASTAEVAARILAADIDVLGVQEVEHIEILRRFNRDHLNGMYGHIA
ncbi:MAG: endonuclease/exonuclease/phosphatase family protein, partial [Pseudomonadota bacterium]